MNTSADTTRRRWRRCRASDFSLALLAAVQGALAQGRRRILCVDRDFAEWPWDDPVLLDTLTQWLRQPQRRLLLLAESFDGVASRFPRFVAWYRLWSHAVSAFSPPSTDRIGCPCMLVVEGTVLVQVVDREHWRGRISLDLREVRQWCDRIDAFVQRSEPAFAATTLGL